MAFDFPASPTVGTRVTMPDGTVRSWDGTKWRAASAVGSFTPPSSPRLVTNFAAVSLPGGTTSETDLQTYTLPAGTLATDGQVLRIRAFGTVANHSAIRSSRLYFGASMIAYAPNATGGPFNWILDATVTRTGATSQIAAGLAFYGSNNSPGQFQTTEINPTETLSGSIIIKTTGQTNLVQAADVVSNLLMVELL